MAKYTVCTKCPIPHIENCGTCFGYGMVVGRSNRLMPVAAFEATQGTWHVLSLVPCPECGSTVKGYQEIVGLVDPGHAELEINYTNLNPDGSLNLVIKIKGTFWSQMDYKLVEGGSLSIHLPVEIKLG